LGHIPVYFQLRSLVSNHLNEVSEFFEQIGKGDPSWRTFHNHFQIPLDHLFDYWAE